MINPTLMEHFASARLAALESVGDHVVDEIFRPRSLGYRLGARLVSLGAHLMGTAQPDHARAA